MTNEYVEIFRKRLPLEDEDFKEKYWNKNNYVFMPANRILQRNGTVYFRVYKDNILIKNTEIISIKFKRGDLFMELKSNENVKIPMNMVLVDSFTHLTLRQVSALFKGCDKWRVSDDSDVPDCEYMITSFSDDNLNPLLNPEIPRKEQKELPNGTILQFTPNGISFRPGYYENDESDEDDIELDDNGCDGEEYEDENFDETEDETLENWDRFFSILQDNNDDDKNILVTVLKKEEDKELDVKRDLLLSGQLKEFTVDDEFKITIDDEIVEILDSLEEIDVHIPEDTTYLFGIIPCTVKIQDTITNALISFGCPKNDDLSEDVDFIDNNSYDNESENDSYEEVNDENIEAWNSLYEYIDIMFRIDEPVYFSIHNPDTKEVIMCQELSGICYKDGIAILTVESDEEFTFNMAETIISMNGDLKTRMFSALFKASFIVDDNNTSKEFDIFITNEK